jgi:hypothetical protein
LINFIFFKFRKFIDFEFRFFMMSTFFHSSHRLQTAFVYNARSISQRAFGSEQKFCGGAIHIPKIVRENLEGAFGLCDRNPYSAANLHHLSRQAGYTLNGNLPPEVKVALNDVARSGRSYVQITGIPRDRQLPSDLDFADQVPHSKKTSISELFIMGLGDYFGLKMFEYRQHALTCQHLIQNEFPKMDVGAPYRARHFYMDHAWHPQFPAILIRSGLRAHPDFPITTRVVANSSIIQALTPAQADVLRQNPFKVFPESIHSEMERSHDLPFSHQRPYIGPPLIGEDDGIMLRVNLGRMSPETPDTFASETLDQVEILASEQAEEVELSPDTCLVVNNRRALMTGTEFDDKQVLRPQPWIQSARLIEETRLWRQLAVLETDFPFLSTEQFSCLSKHLNSIRLMNGRMLTYNFRPHEQNFSLKLPESLQPMERKILEILLAYGPAYPSRFI